MTQKKLVVSLVIVLSSALLISFANNDYFKITKSLEILGEVYEELANNYVLEIDPEIMVEAAIDGILSSLDPYTEYFSEELSEDIQILSNGFYTGFGFTIAPINGEITIVDLTEKNSAFKEGIRIGDKLYKIDSVVVLNMDMEELRNYTRGKIGSQSVVQILRSVDRDTLSFTLARENINLPNVSYSGLVENNIGYIKLESFGKSASGEVRNAFSRLKNESNINGLILDLRGNPGGILTAAVEISELFLPGGTLIVSTKGKTEESKVEHRAIGSPLDLEIPMVILIDEYSASASEVLAGALQDWDRAIIIGERSFGKGLVQTVFDLPYNSYLKITTAKYYTPSGRCIQKIKFGEKYDKKEVTTSLDTVTYYTNNGRPVYELAGILPDTSVVRDSIPEILYGIIDNYLIFNYANDYAAKLDSLPSNFTITNSIYKDFEKYLIKNDFVYLSDDGKSLKDFDELLKKNQFARSTKKDFSSFKKNYEKDKLSILKKHRKEISKYLKWELLRRFNPNSKIIRYSLDDDDEVKLASRLMLSKYYASMLKK